MGEEVEDTHPLLGVQGIASPVSLWLPPNHVTNARRSGTQNTNNNNSTNNQGGRKREKQNDWKQMILDRLKAQVDHSRKHWKREKYFLRRHWKALLLGVVWQYVHNVAHNLAYYLHTPKTPLNDLGFQLTPAFTPKMQIWSEILFFIFVSFVVIFITSPFLVCPNCILRLKGSRPLYTFAMLARTVTVLAFSQTLRIVSFLVTSLPAPNYHCRPGSPDYKPPRTWQEIMFRADAFFSCGDLVFSSHTIFVLLCALTVNKYCPVVVCRVACWVGVVIFCLLVLCSRKHYSIDVVIACYVVPLLWVAYDHYFPDYIPPAFQEPLTDVGGHSRPRRLAMISMHTPHHHHHNKPPYHV